MSLLEHQIISRVLDDNSFFQLDKYNLKQSDFTAIPEVYSFVKGYVSSYGNVPDFRTVVEKFDQFEYQGDIANNLSYMAKSLKGASAKRQAFELLQHKVESNFSNMDGTTFANWLSEEAKKIADEANSASNSGTNLATNGAERLGLYLESKEQGTGKYIATPYPTLTTKLSGGFELGDYVTLLAYTNKGKSWIATDIGTAAWQQGNGVLDYRPEISKSQMMNRFDTVDGKFNNVGLKLGKLIEKTEQDYFAYLNQFNEQQDIPYIIKTMDDMAQGLTLDLIEADLQQHPDISMVILDGFNLMQHGGNSREAMAGTSRKLRQLFGRHKVVGIVVHQTPTAAEKEGNIDLAEDSRIPKTPDLTDYSETIAVVQDGVTVLTFNQIDGIGALKIAKAKAPNAVGTEIELVCNFNIGTIREPELLDAI